MEEEDKEEEEKEEVAPVIDSFYHSTNWHIPG